MQATNIVIGLIITVKSSCAFEVIKKKKKRSVREEQSLA